MRFVAPWENASPFRFSLSDVPWREVAPGLPEKSHSVGAVRFRIVEFSVSFREPDGCLERHTGLVLSGEMVVNMDGRRISYRRGDVINVSSGVRHRPEKTVETAEPFLIEGTR